MGPESDAGEGSTRRTYLKYGNSVALGVAFAGCGADSRDSDEATGTPTPTGEETASPT